MNKKTIVLLSVLVFILLIIWGYNSLYNPKVVDNVNTNAGNKSEEIDISNWVEYRNEELGFEFKYPSDWAIYDYDDCSQVSYITEDELKINKYQESLIADIQICKIKVGSLEKYLQDFGYNDIDLKNDIGKKVVLERGIAKIEKDFLYIKLDGNTSYIFKSSLPWIEIYVPKGNNIIYKIVSGWHSEEFSEEYIIDIIYGIKFID